MNRPDLRIGDLERDAAVSALGEHYAQGRLTKEEYDERADVAWRARTRSDLAPIFADLPALQPVRPATPPIALGGSSKGRSRRSAPPVLPVLLLLVVVAGLTGLEVWPFVLLGLVYVWLRTWMGVSRVREQWARRADRVAPGSALEPWRRPRF